MSNGVGEVSVGYLVDAAVDAVPEGYKRTEVGVIPGDWGVASLAELGKFKNGINKSADAFGHGYPFVNLMDIFGDSSISSVEYLGLIDSNVAERKAYSLEDGDVIFVRSSVKPSGVGLTAVVDGGLKNAVYSGFLIRFRSDSRLGNSFKKYCFSSAEFRNRLLAASSISANTNISQDSLKQLPIAFPISKTEQAAIANALSDVDALINSLESLITKKQAIKTATMQQLLTGRTRLPQFATHPDGRPKGTKQSELGETNSSGTNLDARSAPAGGDSGMSRILPEDWEVVELGALLKIRHGRSQKEIKVPDGLYPILATGGEIGRTNTLLYSQPSILIGRKGTIDRPRYASTPFWTVDTLFYSEVSDRADAKFLFYKFCMIDWMAYNEASGVPSLNASTIEAVSVTVPSAKEEQSAVAPIISEMDAGICSLQQRLEKTRQIKQGMMQELLTGRTRLV